jgi:chromosome segregation ATPase
MEAIEKAVEGISAEISRFKAKQKAAQAEAEQAAERIEELNTRRTALASDTFSGERGVAEEFTLLMKGLVEALDEETAALSRTKTVAEDVARQLDRLILEAEVRQHEAQKRFARARYEALCEERYSLDGEAEEAVAGFVEVLERLEGLYAAQVRAAADAEDPFLAHQDPRDTIEQWLARRLDRWLSLTSLEKYDTPLSELDPLALKPEPAEDQTAEWRT